MDRLKHHYDSAPATTDQQGNMPGFDSEFTDVIDYILRITYRIWEGKQVGLCYDYYSDDCPVYTLAGCSAGAEIVVQNTLATIASFPDRTLHAENIIVGERGDGELVSSHRIRTHMTNVGPTEYGPATGKHAVISVIANCILKDNKIVEEWLVRDNYSLCEQLGYDPVEHAKKAATKPIQPELADYISSEIARINNSVTLERVGFEGDAQQDAEAFVLANLQNIYNARMVGDVHQAYAPNASLHASANRNLNGHNEIINFYVQLIGTLGQLRFSADYVTSQPYGETGVDVAVRWGIAGVHTGGMLYGEPTGAPIFILGETHYRVIDGVIQEEWTVFDELSVMVQVERARLANEQSE